MSGVNVPEMVKLLNEMQEEVKANLIKTVEVYNNAIIVTAFYFKHNLISGFYDLQIKFEINGKPHNITRQLSESTINEMGRFNTKMSMDAMVDYVATAIAEDIVRPSFNIILSELYKHNPRPNNQI